jgi:hypothetical protein
MDDFRFVGGDFPARLIRSGVAVQILQKVHSS